MFDILDIELCVGGFVKGKRKFELVGEGVGIVTTDDRSRFIVIDDGSMLVVSFNDERVLDDEAVDGCAVRDFVDMVNNDNDSEYQSKTRS